MEWAEAEQQVKALMEKHGYRTQEGVPARIDWEGREHLFEGIVEGTITRERHGDGGFGYDAVFMPDGYDITFAQMDAASKNAISHRGRAIAKLVDFLGKN